MENRKPSQCEPINVKNMVRTGMVFVLSAYVVKCYVRRVKKFTHTLEYVQ